MIKGTAAAAAVVGIALLLPLPAFGAVRHGPDLQVKYLTFKPAPPRAIVEHDGTAHFTLHFTLVNAGDRPAGASEIGASVVGSHTQPTKSVPALAARSSRSYTMGANGYDWKLVSAGSGLGFRKVGVCADVQNVVKETNALNNCSKLVNFRAVPRTWLVNSFTHSSRSDNPSPTSFENVDTSAKPGMKFKFAAVITSSGHPTDFVWLASGGVQETRSGYGGATGEPGTCENGAAYTGHGDVAHDPWDYLADPEGYLRVTWDFADYYSTVWDPNYTYEVSGPCVLAGATMDSLVTTGGEYASPSTVQNGHFGPFDDSINTITDSWSFKADVPGGSG